MNTVSDDELLSHLPSGTTAVIKVNNRQIIKRLLFDALFSSDFTQNELDQIDFNKRDRELPSSGINLSENVLIFRDTWQEKSFTGFLFKLIDQKDFARFQWKNEGIVKTFNEHIGCIIVLPDGVDETEEYFQLYASNLLQPNTDKLKPKTALENTDTESLVHLYYSGSEDSYVQDLSMEASVNRSVISFNGRGYKNPAISYDSLKHHVMTTPGKEKHLEIQAAELPDSLNNYIDILLREINLEFPQVMSQQLFLYGTMIDNIDGSTMFLPLFDGVFRFSQEVNIRSQVDSLCQNGMSSVERITESCIRIGQIDYHFKQLSPTEVWIGITGKMNFHEETGAPLPRLKGYPAAALVIEGKGLIAQIAQMLPPVQYTKALFEDLEYFDIHTEEGVENQLLVKGEMRFKGNKNASLELFKYLLKF